MNSTTTMGYLYRNMIINELKCVEYLKSKNLLTIVWFVQKRIMMASNVVDNYVKQQGPVKRHSDGTLKKNCDYEVY